MKERNTIRRAILLAFLALIMFVVIKEVLNPYKEGFWLVRTLFWEVRAFEITVELEVDGNPVKMTRVVGCIPHTRLRDGFTPIPSYVRTIAAFGERLPTGEGVMVVVPGFCGKDRQYETPEGFADLDLLHDGVGFIPLIGLTDDQNPPESFTAIVHPIYFEQEAPRIRFVRVSVRPVPGDSSFSEVDEFNWFGSPRYLRLDGAAAEYYRAIPEAEWSRDAKLREQLASVTQPVVVTRDSLDYETFKQFDPRVQQQAAMWMGRAGLPPARMPGEFGARRSLLAPVVPLRLIENAYEPFPPGIGTLIYYRKEPGKRFRHGDGFRIGESLIGLPEGQRALIQFLIFDPGRREILWIEETSAKIAANQQ